MQCDASADGGIHGYECEEGQSSNNSIDSSGIISSDCYHVIEITGQQWFWSFDCLELGTSICDTGTETMEVYGSVPVLSLKKGETYLATMTSIDVTHAPWFQHLDEGGYLPGQQPLSGSPYQSRCPRNRWSSAQNTAGMFTRSWQPN